MSSKIYNGKTAVIIGGTHGIGLATAQLLLSRGASVLVTGHAANNIPSAKASLAEYGQAATVIQSDITSTAARNSLPDTVRSTFGSDKTIDMLFINAGYCKIESFLTATEEAFDRTVSVNLKGAFFVAQKLAPLITSPNGCIVFTTSVTNAIGFPGLSVYSPTKAGIKSLVENMASELAGKIRVNAVSPGFVKTPTMGVRDEGPDALKEFEEEGRKHTPLGRCAQPEEIASAVAWVGMEATFMTSQELVVDGGMAKCQIGRH